MKIKNPHSEKEKKIFFFFFFFDRKKKKTLMKIKNPPSEKEKKSTFIFFLLFGQEKEEENIIENKEPLLREEGEKYCFNFSSFFDRKRRNLSLKINTPPLRRRRIGIFLLFFLRGRRRKFL